MVVSWWYQCHTCVAPVWCSCYLLFLVWYLCCTCVVLTGTWGVPVLYLCGTCSLPVLADLSMSINCCMSLAGLFILLAGNITCWCLVGTILVLVWYLGGTLVCSCLVQVLHQFGNQCVTHFVFMLADLGRSLNCWQTCAGLLFARSQLFSCDSSCPPY